MPLTERDVVKLYVAMFHRAPEGQGVQDWYNAAITNNWDLGALAQSMLLAAQQVVSSNPEYQKIYPEYVNVDPTNPESVKAIIETVYEILFNKTYNDDPEGINTWVQEVTEKGEPLGNVIASITLAAEQIANGEVEADEATLKAAKAYMNKVDVAEYVAQKIPTFNGDFQLFQGFIASVTDDPTTVDAALQAVDTVAAKLAEVNLTPDPDYFIGTSGDDTFVSLPVVNLLGKQVNTLNSTDVIDGLDGNDTLRAQLVADTISPRINNIETFSIRAVGTATLDFSDTSGVQSVINDSSVANLSFRNLDNFVELKVKDVIGNTTTLDYQDFFLGGLTDKQTIKLQNVAKHTINLDSNNNLEILDIVTETLASDDVKIDNVKNVSEIYISGDANIGLNFGTIDILKKVDASNLTADSNIDLTSAAASDVEVIGGSGNDTVIISNVDQNDSFDLGAGDNDQLMIVAPQDVNETIQMKGIETIGFSKVSDNVTMTLDGADSVKTIKVENYINNDQDDVPDIVAIANVGDTLENIVLNAGGVLRGDIDEEGNKVIIKSYTDENGNPINIYGNGDGFVGLDGIQINSSAALINTNDVLNLSIENIDENGNAITPEAGTTLYTEIDVRNFETLNIKTAQLADADALALKNLSNVWKFNEGTSQGEIDTNPLEDLSKDLGGIKLKITNDTLKTLTIDSPNYVYIEGLEKVSSISTIDASKAGGIIITDTSWKGATFKGSAGLDVVNLGVNGSTSIDLGAGDDIFVAATKIGGNLTLNGGDGNDILDISADMANDDAKNRVLIATGSGKDKVVMNPNNGEDVKFLDFTAGAGGDVLDFSQVNSTTTSYKEIQHDITQTDGNQIDAKGVGLLVVTKQTFMLRDLDGNGTLSISEILDVNADKTQDITITLANANDSLYTILSDGANSYLFYMEDADGSGAIDSDGDTATLVATFVGVGNPALFEDTNFVDFSA